MPVSSKSDPSPRSVKTVQMERKNYGWKRWALSLEWKVEGVTDGQSKGGDCDEVICAGWGEPGGESTDEVEPEEQRRELIQKVKAVGDL